MTTSQALSFPLRRFWKFLAAGMLAAICSPHPALAAVRLPTVFSDHMVLQADRPVKVWGTADAGEKIKVSLGSQSAAADAGADGKWSVEFPAMPASSSPISLSVQGGDGAPRSIQDILVGEVWLCSGQSNMALPVSKAKDAAAEQAAADWPQIRMFQPGGKWVVCSPSSAGAFSAAAYYFGREIHKTLGRPVGLLNASSGGTPIELWTSAQAQRAVPELEPLFAQNQSSAASEADAKQAESDSQQAVEVEGKRAVASSKTAPGELFEKRIVPIIPFGIRGVIWYQGEANSYTVNANLYGVQLATMIGDWRAKWGDDFAFIAVQLPEFGEPQTQPSQTHGRVLVREGVLKSLSLPHTGMAVTLGTGEEKSNHPLNKQEAGRRLALWALAETYGKKDLPASGPIPESSKIDGQKVVVTFSHADGGLAARGGGPLKGFAISGADGNWVWGDAEIQGNAVSVSSPAIKDPVAVRYAWATNPADSNLVNGAGLPATPFRTDNEPLKNAFHQ